MLPRILLLATLDGKIAEKAQLNALLGLESNNEDYFLAETNDKLSQVIRESFIWAKTLEGYDYWDDIYRELQNQGR